MISVTFVFIIVHLFLYHLTILKGCIVSAMYVERFQFCVWDECAEFVLTNVPENRSSKVLFAKNLL